jgi:hypothetical protein
VCPKLPLKVFFYLNEFLNIQYSITSLHLRSKCYIPTSATLLMEASPMVPKRSQPGKEAKQTDHCPS